MTAREARTVIDGTASLWDLVERRAAVSPGAVMAVDEGGRTLTFVEYREQCERAASGIAALGVGVGTNVSWQLPTWLESLVLAGALSRLGAVQNPMLPIYREREVRFATRQTGAELLVVPSQWRGFDYEAMARAVATEVGGLEVLVADRSLPCGEPRRLPPVPPVPAAPGGAPVRWVFYTSGTTADPKGAQHTDATIAAVARGMGERLELTPGDRNALLFPFTHVAGPIWLFASLMFGASNVLMEAFDPERTVEVLRREHVTLAGSGTAFHLAYLSAQRDRPGEELFPDVRAFPGGGAPKPPQLHYDLKGELGGVGILSGYGLTEAPILTMAAVGDPDEKLAGTEGRPMRGVDLRVVTLDGRVAVPGEEGEVRARAPQLMTGYLDRGLDADAFDEEGYFRTGDLGVVDEEGYVAITGRVKDVIIRKGENISAKELEDLLFTHPKVADAAVIGLPDPRSGERACAVVVPAQRGDPPTPAELLEFLRGEGLMVQKIPEQLEIVDVLPRNAAGKVLKHELRAQYTR